MLERVLELLEHASSMMSLFAVAVMVVGFVLAAKRYFAQFNVLGKEENFTQFKIGLGRALTQSGRFGNRLQRIGCKCTRRRNSPTYSG